MITAALATAFFERFRGLERAYGTYDLSTVVERGDGKQTGKAVTVRGAVTPALMQAHLEGKCGIGVIPINDDSACTFGAIDIDVYAGLDLSKIVAKVNRAALPLIVCRSKSGGAHVYLFAASPVPAIQMRDKLREFAALLGHGTAEVFPKQTILSPGSQDLGSWINLPYFDVGAPTARYAVRPDGSAILSVEEFLHTSRSIAVEAKYFKEIQKESKADPLAEGRRLIPDGPPCLQNLVQIGIGDGNRNEVMFNLGVYYRKSVPNTWVTSMEEANQRHFTPPLEAGEINQTAGALKKKDYQYTCSKQPLVQYCNATVCRGRKWGIGGGEAAFPTLGQLRKLCVSPPVWFLDVIRPDGQAIPLELTTDQLRSPNSFQLACMEALNVMPSMPTATAWSKTIQELLMDVQEIEAPAEAASVEGQFWELVEAFCVSRVQANTSEEILLGKPWTNDGKHHFRTQDLAAFLKRKGFTDFKLLAITKALKMRKKSDGTVLVNSDYITCGGRKYHVWILPEFARRGGPLPLHKTEEVF